MQRIRTSRRTFGRLAGAAGLGALSGGVLIGAPSVAAPTWRVTGRSAASLQPFDDAMRNFMQARDISAGQLAVTYQGRLVMARGYTYSDDPGLTVQPTSLFRLASISKSVTAAAVVALAQDGKLSMNAPVTSLVDLVPPAGQQMDPRMSQVTMSRLLQHTGGWDRGLSGDPMFMDRTISRALGVSMELHLDDVVRYMSGRPLDFAPGSRVAYSNYGYGLARQVIEKVSGLPYASYVQQRLFAPLGITRMKVAWSIAPLTGEVPYRSQYTGSTVLNETGDTVPAPYGTFSMRLQEGNGRWAASAVDLARWSSAFDAAGPVFTNSSLSRIFAQPEVGVNPSGWYYGLGWQVRPVSGGTGRNTWHTGSLPGTSTLLVRGSNGLSFAALFNQRDDASGLSYSTIDPDLWAASRRVTSWPSHNLFPAYF
ncbi:serine hydrolase [Micromonospora sp. KC721]|uniref:serine hydrolase domain-containing protein n=1 Tax=Micromonospora sp. KC721 TaxID=2530380 RepID=UPI0010473584|nr:serine hydrolase domain-containing protein [Micromonospora sp. KC721]TDB79850.1 class A beta-lactamase-related serine hydrolase [Micromonospora sp. KC721]